MKLQEELTNTNTEQNVTKDTSTQNAREENNNELNSEQIIEREEVEDTPFMIVKQDEKWFVTLGKYRLTSALDSKEKAREEANKKGWTQIMQVVGIMIEEYK